MDKKEKIRIMGEELEESLDELYQKFLLFPKTEEQKYLNTLTFAKKVGFKVMRNGKGKHKLIFRE